MSNIQVNFGHILPETSKSHAFWDMGLDSHLKGLLLFSPNDLASSDGTIPHPLTGFAAHGPATDDTQYNPAGFGRLAGFLCHHDDPRCPDEGDQTNGFCSSGQAVYKVCKGVRRAGMVGRNKVDGSLSVKLKEYKHTGNSPQHSQFSSFHTILFPTS